MILENIFDYVNESTYIYVLISGKIKAVYDGKNSIPEELNSKGIIPHGIKVVGDKMFVEIEED